MLTCDATARFRATPPAFKLIRKILQSGSSVNLLIEASLADMVMLPTSWTHFIPDCNRFKKLLSYPFTMWGEEKTEMKILYYLVEGIIYEIQEWCELAENNSFCRTIPFNHEPNFFPLERFKPVRSKWKNTTIAIFMDPQENAGKVTKFIDLPYPKSGINFFFLKSNNLKLLRGFLLEKGR